MLQSAALVTDDLGGRFFHHPSKKGPRMPVKLSVGLSRKVGEPNYGSRGAIVNIEMELDSALLSEPQRLQERIGQLFGVVRASLAKELNGNGTHAPAAPPASRTAGNGNGNGHGQQTSNGDDRASVAPATPQQVKAVYAIARSKGIQLPQFLHQRFQVTRADDLTKQEASRLIDELKNQG